MEPKVQRLKQRMFKIKKGLLNPKSIKTAKLKVAQWQKHRKQREVQKGKPEKHKETRDRGYPGELRENDKSRQQQNSKQ